MEMQRTLWKRLKVAGCSLLFHARTFLWRWVGALPGMPLDDPRTLFSAIWQRRTEDDVLWKRVLLQFTAAVAETMRLRQNRADLEEVLAASGLEAMRHETAALEDGDARATEIRLYLGRLPPDHDCQRETAAVSGSHLHGYLQRLLYDHLALRT